MRHADQQRHGGAERDRHANEEVEARADEGEADVAAHEVRCLPREAGLFVVLASERLHHAQGREDLLHDARGRGLHVLHLRPFFSQLPAARPREDEQDWRHAKRHHGHLPVNERRDVDHPEQGEPGSQKRDEPVDGDMLDAGGIMLDTVDRFCSAVRVMV